MTAPNKIRTSRRRDSLRQAGLGAAAANNAAYAKERDTSGTTDPIRRPESQPLLADLTILMLRGLVGDLRRASPVPMRNLAESAAELVGRLGHWAPVVRLALPLNDRTAEPQVSLGAAEPIPVRALLRVRGADAQVEALGELFRRAGWAAIILERDVEPFEVWELFSRARTDDPSDTVGAGTLRAYPVYAARLAETNATLPDSVRYGLASVASGWTRAKTGAEMLGGDSIERWRTSMGQIGASMRNEREAASLLLHAPNLAHGLPEAWRPELLPALAHGVGVADSPGVAKLLLEALADPHASEAVQAWAPAAARKLAPQLVESHTDAAYGVLKELVEARIVDIDRLPADAQRAVRIESWAAQYVAQPRVYVERLASQTDLDKYQQLLKALTRVAETLLRRGAHASVLPLLQGFEQQRRATAQPFAGRPELIAKSQSYLCREELLDRVVTSATRPDRTARGPAIRLLRALGPQATPYLLSVVLGATDPVVEREAERAIERLGAEAGHHLLMEIETFRHPAPFTCRILRMLAKVRYRDAVSTVIRHLDHMDPDVRSEAAATAEALSEWVDPQSLSERIPDNDDKVTARLLRAIASRRWSEPRLNQFLLDALSRRKLQGPDTVVEACYEVTRQVGNFADPQDRQRTIEAVIANRIDPGPLRGLRRGPTAEHLATMAALLGDVGSGASIPVLKKLASHPDELVQAKARQSLQRLQGKADGSA